MKSLILHLPVESRVGTAQQRYETFLLSRPEIMARVPLRMIASYLRITPEYLSKLRRDRK